MTLGALRLSGWRFVPATRCGALSDCFASVVRPLDVSALDRDGLIGLARVSADDLLDSLLAGDGRIHALLDPVGLLVSEYAESAFDVVASVESDFWDGLLQVATYQLQRNLGRVFSVSHVSLQRRTGLR